MLKSAKPALVLLLLTYTVQVGAQDTFRMPAEWEPQEAVWVGIFHRPGRERVSAAIIKSIYKQVQVRLNFQADSTKYSFNRLLNSFQIDTTKLQWILDSVSFNWPRDPGPQFLVNEKGEQKVIDFGWNDYGSRFITGKKPGRIDNIIGRTDIRMAGFLKLPVLSTPVVAEGGGLETNGRGVLMSIEETALQRNPDMTLPEIEKEYLRVTGCSKMIWLKRMTLHDKSVPGLLVGNWTSEGANGHIDEVARFVSPNTILLAKIDASERKKNPISQADDEILKEDYEILRKATDINGKPFTIIRIPYPDLNAHAISYLLDDDMRKNFPSPIPHLKNGDTLKFVPAVSYMNFMITNGIVLVPAYWKEGMPLREKEKDEEVKKIFEKLFPNRKIIQINPYSINGGGGGIHCATLQQPKKLSKVPSPN
ncbi:MAG: agmatine deiminase family protein [Terrimonas sp.]|nr:agmatine deiminase family protein [Terrimonas sp.]